MRTATDQKKSSKRPGAHCHGDGGGLRDFGCHNLDQAANTIRRAELKESENSLTTANDLAIRRALEAAGVEFIDENGGGPGVRLRKRHQKKS